MGPYLSALLWRDSNPHSIILSFRILSLRIRSAFIADSSATWFTVQRGQCRYPESNRNPLRDTLLGRTRLPVTPYRQDFVQMNRLLTDYRSISSSNSYTFLFGNRNSGTRTANSLFCCRASCRQYDQLSVSVFCRATQCRYRICGIFPVCRFQEVHAEACTLYMHDTPIALPEEAVGFDPTPAGADRVSSPGRCLYALRLQITGCRPVNVSAHSRSAGYCLLLPSKVHGEGFEPSKSQGTTGLQSAGFSQFPLPAVIAPVGFEPTTRGFSVLRSTIGATARYSRGEDRTLIPCGTGF